MKYIIGGIVMAIGLLGYGLWAYCAGLRIIDRIERQHGLRER